MNQEQQTHVEERRESPQVSFFNVLLLGLHTVLSEWKWLGLKGLRTLEIHQLNRRLDQEYLTLGRLQYTEEKSKKVEEEIELCEKQISFLEEEIETLENELDKTRQDYIAKRIEHWNLT